MIKAHKIKLAFFLTLFVVTSVFLLLSLFYKFPPETELNSNIDNELFNADLVRLNSQKKVNAYVDSLYNLRSLPLFDTATYVGIASQTTKERFYFGISNYHVSENWIAWLSGKFIWTHLSAIVKPNDILKHSDGLCSQQTIVFMEILRNKGINFRSVGLGEKKGPGHFICEVHYKNSWRLHDVTKEPQWPKIKNDHESMEYYLSNRDSLYKVYEYKMTRVEYNKVLEKVAYGPPNEFPAKNMLLFHKTTKLLMYLLPAFFLLMFFWYYRKYKSVL